jgi:hypothetical protein
MSYFGLRAIAPPSWFLVGLLGSAIAFFPFRSRQFTVRETAQRLSAPTGQ